MSCIGDNCSDEDVFDIIDSVMTNLPKTTKREVFACTVGKKLSKAKFYQDDTVEVVNMLHGLTLASESASGSSLRAIASVLEGWLQSSCIFLCSSMNKTNINT